MTALLLQYLTAGIFFILSRFFIRDTIEFAVF
jgi:hypothetical protein